MLPMTGRRVLDIDRHAHDGVDHGERIRARFDAAARVLTDVGLVGRELGDDGLRGHRAGRPATTCADMSG